MRGLPENLTLREVLDADGPGLEALVRGCFEEYAKEGVVFDEGGLEADLKAWATHLAREGDGKGWVVEETTTGRIVGMVGYGFVEGETYELKRLYLDAGLRGGRIAVKLLEKVERAVLGHGGSMVMLWSDSRFKRGHNFYRREGFEDVGKRRQLNDPSNTTEFQFIKAL